MMVNRMFATDYYCADCEIHIIKNFYFALVPIYYNGCRFQKRYRLAILNEIP